MTSEVDAVDRVDADVQYAMGERLGGVVLSRPCASHYNSYIDLVADSRSDKVNACRSLLNA